MEQLRGSPSGITGQAGSRPRAEEPFAAILLGFGASQDPLIRNAGDLATDAAAKFMGAGALAKGHPARKVPWPRVEAPAPDP